MTTFSLLDLQAIARDVIADPSITIRPDGVAQDVPGWDSLNHTLIIMDVNEKCGIELAPNRAARARDFAHLLRMIQHQINQRRQVQG
jgi:acyl carrier protein